MVLTLACIVIVTWVNHILNQQSEKWRLWVEYPTPGSHQRKSQPSIR
jgi:hypothetical protein